jgi:hypothetical protein
LIYVFGRWTKNRLLGQVASPSGEVPQKSHFEQVHRVSEFGGLNLVKIPFFVHFDAEFGSSFGRIVSELATIHPGT